jgi:hypothetical protein
MPYMIFNHADGPINSIWTGCKTAEDVALKYQYYDEAGGTYDGEKVTFEEYLVSVHTDELCAAYDMDY